jgi:hypothetical protein
MDVPFELTQHHIDGFLSGNNVFTSAQTEEINLFDTETYGIHENQIPNDRPSHKIGRIAERILKAYFEQNSKYELLLQNLVIKKDNTTIGELDFMVRDLLSNRLLHIELACKFYLYDAQEGVGRKGWIGPNRKDKLHEKWDRIVKHQLPLLYHEDTLAMLKSHGIETHSIQQSTCFKAYLFTPIGEAIDPLNHCVNANAWHGFHIPYKSIHQHINGSQQVALIPKPDWICKPHLEATYASFDSLLETIGIAIQNEYSILLWVKHDDNKIIPIFVTWWASIT